MAFISVIIPACNGARLLLDSVRSVLGQSFRDYELIVVDDGAGEDVEPALREVASKIVFCRRDLRGAAAARNFGAALANGQWIAFLDSGDVWRKNRLREHVDAVKAHPEIRFTYTGETVARGGMARNGDRDERPGGWVFPQCLSRRFLRPSLVALHAGVLHDVGGFDESLPVCEDYDLWLRISLKYPVYYIRKPLVIKGEVQGSKQVWGADRYRIQSLEKLLRSDSLPPDFRRLVKLEIVRRASIVSEGAMKRGRLYEAYLYRNKVIVNSL